MGLDKEYDRTTHADVVVAADTRVAGDDLTVSHGGATFADWNAGFNKTVSITGVSLSGADAGNYNVTQPNPTVLASIHPRLLVVGATGVNKQYDGTTSATVALADNRIAGDQLTVGATASASFDDRHAGTGKTVNVSGIDVAGADAGNYVLYAAGASTQADITPRPLNVTAAGVNKMYDRSDAASVTYGNDSLAIDSIGITGTARFDNWNAGTGKTVGITGLAIIGINAGNYTLAATTIGTLADITPRPLVVDAFGHTKIYDGTTGATVNFQDDRLPGDVFAVSSAPVAFADRHVGNDKALGVTGIAIAGADAGNYSLANTTAATTGSIIPRSLSVLADASDKVYDGTRAATVNLIDNRIAGDVFDVSGTGTFDTKNAGADKLVSVSGISIGGAHAGNYTLSAAPVTTLADIAPRALNVGATGVNKVYDRSTAATVNFSDDRLAGDQLAFSATASFDTWDVGTGKPVAVGGIAISGGADAGNYALANTTATTTADILRRTLNFTASGVSKVYDGGLAGQATFTDDRVAGDTFVYGATANFGDKNVGTAKALAVTGIGITGAGAGNYALGATSASTTADITPRPLNVTGSASKTYDANRNASLVFADDRVGGDALSYTASGLFDDKNAGAGKAVAISGFALGGADAGNYALVGTPTTGTGTILRRDIAVSFTGIDKTYDRTTVADVAVAGDTRLAGDDLVAVHSTATFADWNAGAGKTVTITGVTLAGLDAGNYNLVTPNATATASILQRALVVSATGVDKVYDGNVSATVVLGDNRIAGDQLAVGAAPATFIDRHAGAGKAVNVSGVTLGGADAGNYQLAGDRVDTTASITPRPLNVTAAGVNKVYDRSDAATVNYGNDSLDIDDIGITGTARFDNWNAGTGKAVAVTGIAIVGANAGNYTLANTTASTLADITPRPLVVDAFGQAKTYDGATAAVVTFGDDRIAGDVFTVSSTTAEFADRHAGIDKAIGVAGISIAGADAGNYSVANASAATTGDINPRALNVTAAGVDKVYDGTRAASVNFGDDRVGGDVFDVTGAAAFDNKNVGAGKLVSVSGVTLSGAHAGNYTLPAGPVSTLADITPRTVTVAAAGVDKVYDRSTTATVSFSDDRIAGDQLAFSANAQFDTWNVGAGKQVAVDGIAISGGADAGNYVVGNTTAATTASITPRTLAVTATGVDKVYDGNASATVVLGDNRIAGDQFTVGAAATATFADRHAGAGKSVAVSGIALSGADAGNYALSSGGASTQASITPRALNVTATGVNKVYDRSDAATVNYGNDSLDIDDIGITGTARFDNWNAGTGKAVAVTGLAITGVNAGNYTLANATASTAADITPRSLVVHATGGSKTYDGTTAATVSFQDDRIAGDVFTVSSVPVEFADRHVGSGKALGVTGIAIAGADAGNYAVGNTTASTTGNITPRDLVVTADGIAKVYDGTRAASVNFIDDRIAGDVFDVTGSASFDNKNAGADKLVSVDGISIGGAHAGNYNLSTASVNTLADITPRALNVGATGVDKVYDRSTAATVNFTDDRVGGDQLAFSATASFGDWNVGTGKAVGVNGIALSGGADAGNYVLANTTATTSAAITPRTLHVAVSGVSKVYDGTTAAAIAVADDRIAGDILTVSGAAARFTDKNVGSAKPVSVDGLTVAGADAGNYVLAGTTAATTADITPRALQVTASGNDKVYDGSTVASVAYGDDRVAGDQLSFTGTAHFADRNVAAGKAVNVTGIAIAGGADAGNYVLANTAAAATAAITPADLLVRVDNLVRLSDGLAFFGGGSLGYLGLAAGDDASVLAGTPVWGGAAQGASAPGSYTLSVSGLSAANYRISYADGLLLLVPGTDLPGGQIARQAAESLAPPPLPADAQALQARSRVPLTIATDFLRVDD